MRLYALGWVDFSRMCQSDSEVLGLEVCKGEFPHQTFMEILKTYLSFEDPLGVRKPNLALKTGWVNLKQKPQ